MASYMGHEYTPQDKQSRYRVGDLVRVVKDGNEKDGSFHKAKIGSVGVIKESNRKYFHRDDGWLFKPHEIEPAFRTGDRVKLNKHSGIRACGERGTVSEVRDSAVSVNMDDVSVWGTLLEWLPVDVLDWERPENEPKMRGASLADQSDVGARHGFVADCAERKEQPKPKFKAGDNVVYMNGGGEAGTIKCVKTHYDIAGNSPVSFSQVAYDYECGGWDFESTLQLASSTPHTIHRRPNQEQPALAFAQAARSRLGCRRHQRSRAPGAHQSRPGVRRVPARYGAGGFGDCADEGGGVMWEWPYRSSPINDDTVVTTTIGRLTAALAEALKAVDIVAEPQWKKGDRAFIEVEVTGEQNGCVNFVLADCKHISLTLPATSLKDAA